MFGVLESLDWIQNSLATNYGFFDCRPLHEVCTISGAVMLYAVDITQHLLYHLASIDHRPATTTVQSVVVITLTSPSPTTVQSLAGSVSASDAPIFFDIA